MDGDVKTQRPSEGAARQARTRRTRSAVVDAARTLFLERGYAATTIEAISGLSDTPQATVYRLFSSKLGILKAVLDVSVVGDDQAVAMLDRPQVRALVSDEDPKEQLAGFAALLREVMARAAPMHRILADAARSDEDAAALLAQLGRQRQEGQRRIERAKALLRQGLSVTETCFAVGCTSLGSFSSRFTEIVGEPPSQYRGRDHRHLEVVPSCMSMVVTRPRRTAARV